MVHSNSPNSEQISLEQFIALNEEIASLVQAGVPLELGLESAGTRARRGMKEAINRLSQRMKDGTSLPEALAAERGTLPQVYRAVVQAGLRAGRLPEALEALSQLGRSVLKLQQRISLAFLYPCIVLALAYFLFVGFVVLMVPRLEQTYSIFLLETRGWLSFLSSLNETVVYWGPGIPLVVAVLYVLNLLRRKVASFSTGGEPKTLEQKTGLATYRWFPGMKRIINNFQLANFTELLALLLEHEVPLHEALIVAAEATGDVRLISGGEKLSGRIQLGQSMEQSLASIPEFPPFLKWMMSAGEKQGTLSKAMKQATRIYRSRAQNQSEWFQLIVPVVLVVIIGGGVTLIYGLTLFLPLSDMLRQLGLD